jgi:gliding motility-associated-like protein
MSSKFILKRITAFAVLIATTFAIPQHLFGQVTVTQCETNPVTINGGSGAMAPINFNLIDFAPLVTPQIADIEVEVTWSVADNVCGSLFTGPVDLNAVSFSLLDPATGLQVYANPGDWTGNTAVNGIVTTFTLNGAALPAPGATGSYAPSTFPISNYWGADPVGAWEFNFDHLGGGLAPLCVQSVCITITACEGNLTSVCQPATTLNLDPTGSASLTFGDIDGGSDTSCLLQSVTFSQTNFNCGNIGAPIPVTMTLTDRLGNTSTCPTPTAVTVQDVTPPDVVECNTFPAAFDTIYVDGTGSATLNAATAITSSDACGVLSELIGEQNPPVTYGPQRVFDCTNLGLNTLFLVATDVYGNEQTTGPFRGCRARVFLFDTIAPTALCQDTTVYLDGAGQFTIDSSFVDNGSFDNCPSAVLDYSLNGANTITYTCANLGPNNVTMVVANNITPDRGGASSGTCSAVVTVVDTVSPVASCANLTVDLDPTGNVTVNASTVAAASTDNCGPLTYTFASGTSQAYTCANLGANPVSVTVTDGAGNFSVCSSTVTIQDVTPPTMSCSNVTVTLAAGSASVTTADIDGGSTDACSAVTLSLNTVGNTNVGFTCADVGPQTVELIGEDASGNRDTCTATVTVVDAVAPTAVCQNVDAFLDAAGNVTVPALDLDGGSTDDCAIGSILIDGTAADTTFTCASVGPQAVTLVVADQFGNTANCIATVTVQDTISPTISCQPFTAVLDAVTGQVTVSTTDLVTASGDNCGVASITINGTTDTTFNCVHVGTNQVTVVITDDNGNTASCTSTVTVEDNTAPNMACANITVTLDASGNATVVPADIDGGTTDNCGIASLTFTGGATTITYDCSTTGANNLTLVATDVNGNVDSCVAIVTVNDGTNPTALCQNIDAYLDATGSVTVPVADIDGGSTDNCSITTYTVNGNPDISFACADVGVQTVTLEVTDPSGNTATCPADITVQDTISPTISCQPFTAVLDAVTGQVTVSTTDLVTASGDNCGVASITINGTTDTTFNCVHVGTNQVTVVITDDNGNTASCTSTVTVEDNTAPNIACANITVTLDASGNATVVPADIDGGTTDNCGIASLTFTGGATTITYDCSTTGANNLTLVATDVNGNVDSCVAIVTVNDGTNPTALCQNIDAYLDATGSVTVPVADIDGGSTDNCSITTYTVNGNPDITFACADVGVQTVTLEVTDPSGNTATCPADITVQDTISPTISCQPFTAVLDAVTGQVTVSTTDLVTASGDNCGVASITINGTTDTTFNCVHVGTNQVTVVITDDNGNTASCTSTVTVEDNTAPNIACANITVTLDASGNATVVPADIDGGTTDNCGIASLTFTGGATTITYDCSTTGANNLTLVATDVNGNVDSCVAIVTVNDGTNPTALCQNINAYLDGSGLVTVVPADVDGGSFDNCSIVTYTINNQPSLTYNCGNTASPQNLTLEVTDPSGNTNTCIATVTVLDTVSPVASCQTTPVVAVLSPTGTVNVNAASINNGSSDNCGSTSLLINGLAQETYDCTDLGLNNATLTVTDGSGNSSTCVAQVDVQDNLPPLALCTSPTVYLNNSGLVTVTPAEITDPASSDNCGITSSTINAGASETYTCSDLTAVVGSPMTATLELSDASGNSATCPASITVVDTIAPQALCQNILVQLDPVTGQATVTGLDINSGSSDNCSIVSYLINGSASEVYSCADIGNNTAVLTVEDESGNTATCNATVTVVDATAPTAVCQNITVYLDAAGQSVVNAAQIDGGSSDNCSPLTLLINNQPSFTYTCAQAGLTVNAQLSVADPSGNTTVCIAQVTVLDTISPVANCNTPLDVFLGTGGSATVTATQINAGSTDNCSITSVNINGGSSVTFTCADVGANSVTLTVQDGSANTGTCISTVNVFDTLPPTAICRNLTAYLDNSGQVVVNPSNVNNGSTDNCGAPNLDFSTGGPITYDCTMTGANSATLIVTDASGNVDSCTSTITVLDTVSPVAICTNITVQLDPTTGTVNVPASAIDGGSSDNCSVASILINGLASVNYDCSDVGANTAILTVTDASGNNTTCTATVTVEDITPPAMACQNITVQLDGSGNATVVPGDVDAGTSDNCGIASLTLNGQPSVAFGCADVGVNNVTLIATDVNGNVDSCVAQITVQDTVPPVASCINIDAFLDAAGSVTIFPADVDGGSTDNCAIAGLTVNGGPDVTFGCADVGPQNVTLEVTDVNGNTANCVAVVTVRDTISPTVSCQNITVQLDPVSGQFTIFPADVVAAAADNCGVQDTTINGATSITYDCSNIGANTVNVVVTDVNGNTISCTATLTVEDITPPAMACQNITVQLDGSGNATVVPGDVDAGTSDNCGIASLTLNGQPSVAFGCADVGVNNVTLIATDVNGNVDSCIAQITVQDTVPPIASCINIDAFLDAAGSVTIFPANVDGGSSDNCGIAGLTVNGGPDVTFGCADVGPQNVTLEVTDVNGNTANCVAVVTVRDTILPTMVCTNITVQLDPVNGDVTITPADVDGGTLDNCAIASLTVNGQPSVTFDCANIGANNLTLIATDDNGNVDSCVAVVTVEDVTPPAMVCQNITVQLGPTGDVTVFPADVDGGTTDNCGIASLTINGQPSVTFDCTNPANNTVTLIATDVNGNVDSCSALVTIQDTIDPVAVCQTFDAYLDAAGNVTVNPSDIDGGSTDNCAITVYTINGANSINFTCADVGAQTVTLEVTDAAGNSDNCTATVNVIDTVAPAVVCQNISRNLNASGFVLVPAIAVDAGSTDACGIVNFSLSQDSFTCANVGANNVTLYVTDVNGNIDSCTAVITIVDAIPPTAVCQNITVDLDPAGNVTVLATQVDAGSTDNCAVDSVAIDGQASITYSCADVGVQPVTFEVFDVNGNSSSCFAQITIRDTVPPNAICQPVTIQLDAAGNAILNVVSVNNGSNDNCGIASVLFNNNSSTLNFDCSNVGTNNVTMVVTDVNGNVDSCSTVVTVEDNVPPTATCQSATVFVDASGIATILPSDVDGGSTDACGIDTMFVSPSTLSCNNIAAPATVTLTVVDVNGNSATCNAQVTVVDTVSPTMVCQNITVYLDNFGVVSVTPAQIDGGSTDACGLSQLLINGSSNQLYNCADTGVNVAILTGTDIYGNTSSCNAQITVLDTISPDAQCRQPFDVFLSNTTGDVTIIPADVDSFSTDNCNVNTAAYLINGQPSITYDCGDLFNNQNVVLTVVDESGNTSTCSTVITVRDTAAPNANCQPTVTVNLSSATNNGTVTVNAITLNNNSTDACAPPLSYLINGQPSFLYDCDDIGTNTAVLTVTDASGNSATCTSTVIVNDITPPSAQCVANIIVDLDSTGIFTVQGVDLDNGSFDNCAVTTYLINGNPSQVYDCQDIGNNLATLTVQDSSGNSATCTSVVTVRDLIAPVVVCPTQPVPVYLDAAGVVTVTGTMIDSASFDNCGIQTYLINGSLSQNYTCNNIGLNNAILTVRDSSNNSSACTMQVDVRDTVPPVASCQNITVSLGAGSGIAVVNANSINAGSSDNCGINNYLINGMPSDTFDCTNVGVNSVVLTVTDDYGNSSTCNATVTVQDNAPPVINCSNGLFYLDNAGTVQVQPTDVATGIDACGIANWTIDGAPSATYDCVVAGTTLLDTIVAFDFSGNSASCVSQITVLDTISPVAQCNNATVQLDVNGTYTLVPSIVDDNSFDNCSIATYLINNQPSISYDCQDTGANTVVLTVIDQSGNQSTCTAIVTVEDNVAPVASCRNITVQLNSSGIVVVPAINLNDASFDACGTTFTINGFAADTFNCSNTGPNLVTLEVTDPSGNVSTCQSIVTVQDVTPPTVVCQPYTLYLDNSGNGNISFANVIDIPNSGDNCGVFLYTINGSTTTLPYNCSDVGTDSILVIAEDFSGNEDTCYSVVTIIDSVGPTVNCNNIVVDLTATGGDTLTLAQLGASASDACGIDTIEIVPQIISCADVGVVQVQVIATDVNGNQTICTSDVTVINDGPQPTNNSPATGLCEGQNLALFANPPATGFTYNYQWTGPNGFSSTQENPTISNIQDVNEGWYYVMISPQGAPGCSTMDSTFVNVNIVPRPVLSVNNPLCDGSEAILSVTNDTAYSGTTITYQWFQNGTAVGPDSSIYHIPAVSFADTGNYTMIVTVDGCSDTTLAPMPVVVNPLPAAFTPISNDPCEGDSLVLTSNTPATGPFTYSWEGPAGSTYTSSDSIATLFPVGLGDAGIYTLTITDPNTCTATSSVSVNIIQTPIAPTLNFNDPLCLDDVLELTDTTTYSGPVSYVWLDPSGAVMDTTAIGQYTVVNANSGTYGLLVIENGCLSPQDTQAVTYQPAPSTVDDAFSVPFRDSITGMDVTINDIVRAGYSIGIVDSALNGNIQLNANGTFNYVPGYIFFGVDSFHYEVCDPICPTICDTATVVLDVELDVRCFIPNGLSPNGDGINDELVVVCAEEYPNMQIQIFSRWGNQVYEGAPNGWNAQFNGKDLPDGTYFYVLDYGDGTPVETGYIVVHR